MYMVSSQHDLEAGCCFDYGNAERTANNDGNGTMEAVYVGQGVIWGTGVGDGPWVMADLENGLYPGWENDQFFDISTNTPSTLRLRHGGGRGRHGGQERRQGTLRDLRWRCDAPAP